MSFDYYDWDKELVVQQFVQEFFDQEHLFTSYEIEYLKNNCRRYPKTKDQELNEFQELIDQIDFDKVREKAKEKLDKTDDWPPRKTKITDNPFSEIWDSSGMYEKQDGVGMFGSKEDVEYMIKYLDKNE
jgi:hypothetical protein